MNFVHTFVVAVALVGWGVTLLSFLFLKLILLEIYNLNFTKLVIDAKDACIELLVETIETTPHFYKTSGAVILGFFTIYAYFKFGIGSTKRTYKFI